ncbi:MAG: hypothetical protein ACRCTU_07480 [Zoogloea sp.]|uniref:hypothetical protein n=1 Tax=Zoogloea sp. TaxID=49181 RepID=UPI003F2F9FE3|nr:hypothetical protein [Rhodocyclales bacterium]
MTLALSPGEQAVRPQISAKPSVMHRNIEFIFNSFVFQRLAEAESALQNCFRMLHSVSEFDLRQKTQTGLEETPSP